MTTRTINVDVEVDLVCFSDRELQEELASRKLSSSDATPEDVADQITKMYEAFSLGKDAEAVSIARQIARDVTGRLL